MGRSGRSPSPQYRRRRSRSREREYEKKRKYGGGIDKDRRQRDRSRSPLERSYDRDSRRNDDRRFRRSLSRSQSPQKEKSKIKLLPQRPKITEADLKDKTPDEQDMMKLMGFCSFDSTKGKKVENNNAGEVHVILKRKYRQYMNRKGGFNRPLDFVA